MRIGSWVGMALLVASCGGSKNKDGGGSDAATGGNVDGGTVTGTAPKSLDGTWDVTFTNQGDSSSATVTIADGSVTVTSGTSTVVFAAKGAVNVAWGGRTFTGTHTATGSAGFLPIDPLGDWSVSDSSGGITASISTSTVTASCTGDCSNNVTGDLDGHFSGTKTAPAAAATSWGDLGGTWHVADTGGYACDATFVNASFQATCGNGQEESFSITASVSGDTMSGTATTGNGGSSYELSAHRN